MLNPSITNLLVEARVETLRQAARTSGRGHRSHVTRTLARAFGGAR